MVLDPQLLAEIPECVIVEFLSIVRDEDPGIPKRQMTLFQTKLRTFFFVIMANGLALTHLVK